MSTPQHFEFRGKTTAFYVGETERLRDFESVVEYFQRQGARSRGQAITLARRTAPGKYNQWMSGQRQRQENSMQTLEMRSGVVKFRQG